MFGEVLFDETVIDEAALLSPVVTDPSFCILKEEKYALISKIEANV